MRCTAHRTNGEPCSAHAMTGQRVCTVHGGRSPQALSAARRRIMEAADPAAAELVRLVKSSESEQVRLAAVRDLLDRAGLGAKVKFDGEINHSLDDDTRESLLGRIAELAARRAADGDHPGAES